jgi:O-antigen/teichoic acid export membrane protein
MRVLDRALLVNLSWSFLGAGLPGLVAVVTIPILLHKMGVARFGVLSLAWVVVGYFSLFDFGLGRAMTQLVAQKVGRSEEHEIPSVVWIGMLLMTVLGVIGAFVLAVLSPWIVNTKLGLAEDLRRETLTTFYVLSASIPIVIISTGLRGYLEAVRRFDIVNIVKVPLGVLTYLAPLAVLPFSHGLPLIVVSLVVARLLACAAYLVACLWLDQNLSTVPEIRVEHVLTMLSFGGWMTVSNIVGPLLLYLGRLVLAMAVSVEAVAYFSAPYDVVINLLIIPNTFVAVFFPLFSQTSAGAGQVRERYLQSTYLNLALMVPLATVTFLFARPMLAWWIGSAFADNSYRVAQFLAIGVLVNSVGLISQSLIQAVGRPDLTAKLHVAELVFYIPYLWLLIGWQGVNGAAAAWVIRVALSTVALLVLGQICLDRQERAEHSKVKLGLCQ